MTVDCPFCQREPAKYLLENDLAIAISDGFPLSTGHCLIIPRQHFLSLFEATQEERSALGELQDYA